MKYRAQTSILTIALMILIIAISTTLLFLYSVKLVGVFLSYREASIISKMGTAIEAYSTLLYNKTSGYAYLLLRVFNLGDYPITLCSVSILNCTNNQVMQFLQIPEKSKEILLKKVVVVKTRVEVPPIEAFETEGFINMSVLLKDLTITSIEDNGFVKSQIYVAFMSPINGLFIQLYNISLIINISRTDSGKLEAKFMLINNNISSYSIIAYREIPISYDTSYNFNITVLVRNTGKTWNIFFTMYNISFLGYLNNRLVISKSYIGIIGGGLFPEIGLGCTPFDAKDAMLRFNYIEVHYDNKTQKYYMRSIVEKYVKYVRVVYEWNSTVYPGKNITILIKFKPKFRVSPDLCYNLMIISRSGAFWYVNHVDNRVEIVS